MSKFLVYVGTYTSSKDEGINILELDTSNGKLRKLGVVGEIENPSYLITDSTQEHLYAVSETDSFNGYHGGSVIKYKISPSTGKLEFLSVRPTKGQSPCHLCLNKLNTRLIIANYGEGSFIEYDEGDVSSEVKLPSVVVHEGSGPNKERQEKPHVHFAAYTPEGKYLCVVDLGIDSVKLYGMEDNKVIRLNPGSGPRHLEFHPNGKCLYIINELSSDIITIRYPSLEKIQEISTLPKEYNGESYAAAIHISKDGRFLYASNRGADSIAVFSVDQLSGNVTLIEHVLTRGTYPRDFAIDPTGKYMVVANQNSGDIFTFEIDKVTGSLTVIGEGIKISKPVCVKII